VILLQKNSRGEEENKQTLAPESCNYTQACRSNEDRVFTTRGWWGDFWANLCADLIVAFVVGLVLTAWYQRRSRQAERKKKLQSALQLLLEELRFNLGLANTAIEQLPKRHLIFPFFESSTWEVLLPSQLFAEISTSLSLQLLNTYARIDKANKLYYLIFDPILASGTTLVPPSHEYVLSQIVDRVKEAKPHIEKSIQLCESEIAKR